MPFNLLYTIIITTIHFFVFTYINIYLYTHKDIYIYIDKLCISEMNDCNDKRMRERNKYYFVNKIFYMHVIYLYICYLLN